MSNKLRLQKNNNNIQACIDKANALPDDITNAKFYEATITSSLPSSGALINFLTDTWLKENRTNPNLCVVVIPKFSIEGDGNLQGIFLCTNKVLIKINSVLYYSLSAFKKEYSDGIVSARARSQNLTSANDVGDLLIDTNGTLSAVVARGYGFAVGTYSIIAFIV